MVEALSRWQERWNRAMPRGDRIDRGRLESMVVDPASELANLLPDATAYRAWLSERCAFVGAEGIPAAARHNDLTMWNVLLDEGGSIGVLDWAEAEPAGLPLTDFFYAVADAAAACEGYGSRIEAVRSCFAPGGARAQGVAALERRLSAPLGLTPAATQLCFHACWLRHALNEQRAGAASDRPFLDIVRWQARRALEAAA
ncbi:MAG TPA: phosphotransferase [Thermoleophilaceae bacterium]|nr:phosphotransferase [Thermoleophilaceae bacterium]